MAVKVARGQVTIIDQNDAVSLQAFIGSSQPLTQVYNRDNNAYAPSWAASPYLVLTPSLFVSGQAATDQITSVGNAATLTAGVKSGSAKWYKNGTAIVSGQDSCTIGAASAKYALTVKANHMTVSAPQVRYTFEAVYIDANGLEIPFRAEIQFTQHLNAGAMIAAVAYAPDGIVFKNDEVATLRAHCDLWRGASIDTTNVTYAWGIKDSAVFAGTTLTAAAAGRGTAPTGARGSRSHDHNGRFGNEHGGGRQDNHRIGTVHHFGSQRLHEGRDADLRTECRSRIGSRRFVSLLQLHAGCRLGMPYLDQSSGRDGRLDDKRNHDYGRCRSQLRDLQVRHQGYGHLGGQRLGEQGRLRHHLLHGYVRPHHG
jgi:hypothetical protein